MPGPTRIRWARIKQKDQSIWTACAFRYDAHLVAMFKALPKAVRQYLPEAKIWLVADAAWVEWHGALETVSGAILERDPAVGRDAVAEIEEQKAGSTAQARQRAARRKRKPMEEGTYSNSGTFSDGMPDPLGFRDNGFQSRRTRRSKLEDDVRRASDVGANSRTAQQQAEYAQWLRDQIFGRMNMGSDPFGMNDQDDAARAFKYGFGSTPAGAAQQTPPPSDRRWWEANWGSAAADQARRQRARDAGAGDRRAREAQHQKNSAFYDEMRRAAEAFERMGQGFRSPPPPPPARPGKGPTDADYRALGVAPGASAEAVRVAHRKAALANHPDRGGDAEKAKQINVARDKILASLGAEKVSPRP